MSALVNTVLRMPSQTSLIILTATRNTTSRQAHLSTYHEVLKHRVLSHLFHFLSSMHVNFYVTTSTTSITQTVHTYIQLVDWKASLTSMLVVALLTPNCITPISNNHLTSATANCLTHNSVSQIEYSNE